MLSEQDKNNCKTILALLSDRDIFALVRTSTNNVVSTDSRKEAEKAILNFTQSLDEFFKRRKINKELLLGYIHNSGWPVPRDSDLQGIKDYIIGQWAKFSDGDLPAWETSTEGGKESESTRVTIQRDHPPAQHVYNHFSHTESTHHDVVNYTVVNYNISVSPNLATHAGRGDPGPDHASAVAFVRWFYSLLNSCNPDTGRVPGDFGPQHFFANVQLRLEMSAHGTQVCETLLGSSAVAGKLMAFPVSDRLLFSPSESPEGLKTSTDPFGRKVVLVCGLLHKAGTCVGSFCHSFGLVSDPLVDGSWKVLVMMLRMVESQGQPMPRLYECADALTIENQTLSALQTLQ